MVAILAMSVNASFTASQGINSNVQMDQALTDSLSVVGTKRKLRAAKAIDGDDDNEERAGPSNIFKEFANLLKGKKIDPAKVKPVDPKLDLSIVKAMPKEEWKVTRTRNSLIKQGYSLDDVFTSKVYPKLEGRSFDADALPLYVRISEQTAQQRGGLDQYGVGTLVTNMGQEKLMKYINLGLNSKNHVAVATAERLRAGLVSKWKTEMKPVNYVATALKGGKQANSLDNTKVVNTYRVLWNEAHAAKLHTMG
ncbi:hypothetical protein GN244_ATG00661 [Phytophthora infestans]|uniref:RxLR effector protein n=1 Tax=Phytophthora infestans TaxID=4787 RepID=A0A833X2L3_PHYIN|nr:hypothetical protein GN244_ATG00661 [Phytophthora infestans]KAF4138813.1 hypothetical protein GN958_ATG12022 [Phytophthora infestans]